MEKKSTPKGVRDGHRCVGDGSPVGQNFRPGGQGKRSNPHSAAPEKSRGEKQCAVQAKTGTIPNRDGTQRDEYGPKCLYMLGPLLNSTVMEASPGAKTATSPELCACMCGDLGVCVSACMCFSPRGTGIYRNVETHTQGGCRVNPPPCRNQPLDPPPLGILQTPPFFPTTHALTSKPAGS